MSEYDSDLYAWSERQGALLRRLAAGESVDRGQLDWANIAEEIESLGRAERRALATSIASIIESLMLLEVLPHESVNVRMCVQRRLACSAGVSPAGVEVRAP